MILQIKITAVIPGTKILGMNFNNVEKQTRDYIEQTFRLCMPTESDYMMYFYFDSIELNKPKI